MLIMIDQIKEDEDVSVTSLYQRSLNCIKRAPLRCDELWIIFRLDNWYILLLTYDNLSVGYII